MMKKLSLILALMLALTALPALAAGDVLLSPPDGIPGYSYIFSDGDTLYLTSYEGISVWNPGDAAPTYYAYELPDHDNTYQTAPFLANDSLYALRVHPTSDEEGLTGIDSAAICEMKLENGTATFAPLFDVDWAKLMEESDYGLELNMPTQALAEGDKVIFIYVDTDRSGSRVSHMACADLEEQTLEALDGLDGLWGMTPYKDGKLLMLQQEEGDEEVTLRTYDPFEDDFERFARIEVGSAVASGLAYDEADDKAYLTLDNEVRSVEEDADEPSAALAQLSIQDPDALYSGLILNDGRYAYCGRSVSVMDVSGQNGERSSLTISDPQGNAVLDTVLQPFQSAHGNVRVRVDRNKEKLDNLVENLINQDDSIDIYLLDTTLPVYAGLRSRGFMAPLESSGAISALVEAMYPALRSGLTVDGHIVALPLDVESPCMGISPKCLKALDMTAEDIPDNWNDFLDYLPTLTDKLADNDKVRFTYDFETVANVRGRLFNLIFQDYQNYLNNTDPEMGYNTDLLRGLLDKLDKIDFEALGCLPETDDEAGSSDADSLMDFSIDCAFNSESFNFVDPRLMKLNAEAPNWMAVKLFVAFINPYTKNLDNAMAFMESMANSLPNRVLYSLNPSLNTPVRGAVEEASLRELDDTLQNLNNQLEKAEGAKRNLIQSQIDLIQERKASAEANSWEIPQKSIDWFRANGEYLTVAPADWLDDESRSLITQYCNGQITASAMLQRIDQKVRMMRMEGN